MWYTFTVPVILARLSREGNHTATARESAERLVGLVDSTLVQLDSLPGARLVRRRLNRVTGGAGPASLMP